MENRDGSQQAQETCPQGGSILHLSQVILGTRDVTQNTQVIEPTCAHAQWALMLRFASVCLLLDQKDQIINHISKTIVARLIKFGMGMSMPSSPFKKRQVGSLQRQVAFFCTAYSWFTNFAELFYANCSKTTQRTVMKFCSM